MTPDESAMSRMAALSSSPRHFLRRIRRRCLSTAASLLRKPTVWSSMVTSSSSAFSFLALVFFCCCSAPSVAVAAESRPSAARRLFRYRIPHALHSDWKKGSWIGSRIRSKQHRSRQKPKEEEEWDIHLGSSGSAAP